MRHFKSYADLPPDLFDRAMELLVEEIKTWKRVVDDPNISSVGQMRAALRRIPSMVSDEQYDHDLAKEEGWGGQRMLRQGGQTWED